MERQVRNNLDWSPSALLARCPDGPPASPAGAAGARQVSPSADEILVGGHRPVGQLLFDRLHDLESLLLQPFRVQDLMRAARPVTGRPPAGAAYW